MTPDDAELIRCYCTEESEPALAALVQRHVGLVYRTALRQVGGRSCVAEEIAQSVFVLLARKASTLQRHPSIAGWLHATTRWVAADFLRAEHRRHRRETEAQNMHELSGENHPASEWEHLRPVIDDALGDLRPSDREAILLRYFNGLSLAEIGERLALSEGAARMRIERGLDRLRGRLVRRGVTSTAAALAGALSQSSAASLPAGLAGSLTAHTVAAVAAASGGAFAIGAFTLMNHAKLLVGLAAIVAVGGMGSAVYENAVARRAESALQAAGVRERVLQQQLTESERRIAPAGALNRSAETHSSASNADGPTAAPGLRGTAVAAKSPGDEKSGGTFGQMMLSDTVFREAQIKLHRAGLALTYGPFYRSLNLSPAQVAEFEDAMSEYFRTNIETSVVAGEQGLAPSDPKLAALMKSPIDRLNTRLMSALGQRGIVQLAPYDQTVSARETVNALAGHLYYTDVPLSVSQANQLTALVAANTGQLQAQGLTATPRQVNWTAVLEQAKGVLAPGQLSTLQALGEREQYQQQISELATRAQASNGNPESSASSHAGAQPSRS